MATGEGAAHAREGMSVRTILWLLFASAWLLRRQRLASA